MTSKFGFMARLIAALVALNYMAPTLNNTLNAFASLQGGGISAQQEAMINSFADRPASTISASGPNISDFLDAFGAAQSGAITADQEVMVNNFSVEKTVSANVIATVKRLIGGA